MGMRPGFFAGAAIAAGWQGSTPVRVHQGCAALGLVRPRRRPATASTRSLVNALRRAGGNPIYTEYISGGHLGGILMGLFTPACVDWLLAQRRGVPRTTEPLVSITTPTEAGRPT